MKVEVQKSFEKDISKIADKALARKVLAVIAELEDAASLMETAKLKKLNAKGNYYRIRIADHRLGFKVEKDTVILLRFMARKDIYKYFP
jgi:mRNA interferase RelE/StbE